LFGTILLSNSLPFTDTAVGHVGKCQNFQRYDPCERYFDPDSHLYNSVCASNGQTYQGSRDVACLKKTDPAIGILHEGACTVEEVERTIGLNDVCKVATNMTRWSSHLCGSDNVTYDNAYDFLCAAKSRLEDNSTQFANLSLIYHAPFKQSYIYVIFSALALHN
jgi:Kazal-type serine protease inhibitor domain